MFKRSIKAAFLLSVAAAIPASADNGNQLDGTYVVVEDGTCIFAQSGFDSNDIAIETPGVPIIMQTGTFIGTEIWRNGSGTRNGTATNVANVYYPGNPSANYFYADGQSERGSFTANVTGNHGLQTVTISLVANGMTGQTTSGQGVGGTYVVNSRSPMHGVVNPDGSIILSQQGPFVGSAQQTANGTTITYPVVCAGKETMTPIPDGWGSTHGNTTHSR